MKPEDHICERLAPIVYAKCGPCDVDNTVDEAIESLKSSLASVGPYLSKGIILISFFEKREIKGFFGLTSTIENIYFERWRIPVLIDERPLLSSSKNYLQNDNNDNYNNENNDNISKEGAEAERKYFVDFALKIVQNRLINILEVRIFTNFLYHHMFYYFFMKLYQALFHSCLSYCTHHDQTDEVIT